MSAEYTRKYQHLNSQDNNLVQKAVNVAVQAHEGQTRSDGTPYVTHPLIVADILAEWGADHETIIAGILHDTLEDTPLTFKDISEEFGTVVASLVEGVTKFTQADFEDNDFMDRKIETTRKLFEVMRQDIRVVIIKIADRIHNLRTIDGLSDERKVRFANETLDIYCKIVYHLGMNDVRREMLNICVPLAHPDQAERRILQWQQRDILKQSLDEIEQRLTEAGLGVDVLSTELIESSHDVPELLNQKVLSEKAFYVVIIAKDINACYSIFKVLHALYRPMRRKFHDYIAASPETGYRSLHTTIIGPNKQPIQIRIRTEEMDIQAKKGILLECFKTTEEGQRKASWVEKSKNVDISTRESSEAFWSALQSDILEHSIEAVINGQTVTMPRGATVLDAVYAVYEKKADTVTTNVTVNGKVRELSTMLDHDDLVQIDFGEDAAVQFSWLQSVSTKFARNMIVEVLKERDRQDKLLLGERLLQQEFDHFQRGLLAKLANFQKTAAAKKFNRESFDEIIAMIGEGVLTPREVINAIFPTQKSTSKSSTNTKYRLRCSVIKKFRDEVLPQISSLARVSNVELNKVKMQKIRDDDETFDVFISVTADSQVKYADFIGSLERHSWFSNIRSLLTFGTKAFLVSCFLGASMVLITSLVLFPYLLSFLKIFGEYATFATLFLTIAPVLVANAYFMKLLREYVILMRTERWFFGLGFLLNITAFTTVIIQGIYFQSLQFSLFAVLVPFSIYMTYLIYRFFQTEELYSSVRPNTKSISPQQWNKIVRQKYIGYALRLGAVIIWGIQPLYLKYTPANDVDPFVRVCLTGLGALVGTLIFIITKELLSKQKTKKVALPKDVFFFNIIFGYVLFTYFLNASLVFTTSTNFILFNNFSPVFALMIAAVLWRSTIPYLRQPKHVLWVSLIFLFGSTGSAMIIYNSISTYSGGTLRGDMLGLIAMIVDTVLVVSQIQYMRIHKNISSLQLNLYASGFHILATLPFLAYLYLVGSTMVDSLTIVPVLFGIGAGLLASLGQLLNYETFRRIDGFIAFLMFNISILITFLAEVFFFETFVPTLILVLGGMIIIGSTVLAEIMNTSCQKKGM